MDQAIKNTKQRSVEDALTTAQHDSSQAAPHQVKHERTENEAVNQDAAKQEAAKHNVAKHEATTQKLPQAAATMSDTSKPQGQATPPHLLIIGDICVDLILGELAEWPQRGTETLLDYHDLRAGGAAANSALAAYYLGAQPRLVSATGDDFFGQWLSQQMHKLGGQLATVAGATTVTVGLVHADSERTFLTTQGHLNQIAYDTVLAQLPTDVSAGSLALLSGVFLTPALRRDYLPLIRHLQQAGYQIALDTNWPGEGWSAALRSEVLSWLAHCDHLLLNELEIKHLAQHDDVQLALGQLQTVLKPGASLVVKQGAEGAIGIQNQQQVCVPTSTVKVHDTIGAGDTFNAAYLLARLAGANLEQALQSGCLTASAIVARAKRSEIQAGEFAAFLKPYACTEEAA